MRLPLYTKWKLLLAWKSSIVLHSSLTELKTTDNLWNELELESPYWTSIPDLTSALVNTNPQSPAPKYSRMPYCKSNRGPYCKSNRGTKFGMRCTTCTTICVWWSGVHTHLLVRQDKFYLIEFSLIFPKHQTFSLSQEQPNGAACISLPLTTFRLDSSRSYHLLFATRLHYSHPKNI